MANEDKKDFNAMLMDSKDMPKVQIITDEKSIEKYGGDKMYFAPPIDYDKVMRLVPCGKLLTVGTIRDYFAKQSGADFTEPITAGIFVSIVAWASYQRAEDKTPYWRTLKANGELNAKYPGGVEAQKEIISCSSRSSQRPILSGSTACPQEKAKSKRSAVCMACIYTTAIGSATFRSTIRNNRIRRGFTIFSKTI